jgi:hypothetical protein
MKEEYKEFAQKFAQTMVDEDFKAAHAFFAPWLQKEISPENFRAQIEKWLREINEVWCIEELIFPDAFDIDGNSSTLSSLKEKESWREPRKFSDEVTEENFRRWMVIEFLPGAADERIELDGWFDFWFALIETGGELRIGFFELTDVD